MFFRCGGSFFLLSPDARLYYGVLLPFGKGPIFSCSPSGVVDVFFHFDRVRRSEFSLYLTFVLRTRRQTRCTFYRFRLYSLAFVSPSPSVDQHPLPDLFRRNSGTVLSRPLSRGRELSILSYQDFHRLDWSRSFAALVKPFEKCVNSLSPSIGLPLLPCL